MLIGSRPTPRVAYFVNTYAMGGLEMHVAELAAAVGSRGFEPWVIFPETPALETLRDRLEAGKVSYRRLSLAKIEPSHHRLLNAGRVWQALRELRPDLLHLHRGIPFQGEWVCAVARAAGVKSQVVTEHVPPPPQ